MEKETEALAIGVPYHEVGASDGVMIVRDKPDSLDRCRPDTHKEVADPLNRDANIALNKESAKLRWLYYINFKVVLLFFYT